jgi:putative transposase
VQQEIKKEVKKLIDSNCVIPGEAEACSQVLLVRKPDDTWRFCIDYRELNKVTIPDSFPLPIIDEVLQRLEGKTLYTVFDLLKGYYQLELHENSRKFSAFITSDGVYQWVRIPMGVMNAPSYFQQQIRTVVLSGLEAICIVYIDDVIIFGNSEEEHWRNVRTVLERFKRFGIIVSPKKCQWGMKELQYLGIVVSRSGQWMSEVRKQAFKEIPLPTTMTQLRSFLGAGNYFRKHIEQYARLTKPLFSIVSKGKKTMVNWTPDAIKVSRYTRAP